MGILIFFFYFIKDYGIFYAFSSLINIAFILSSIYLVVLIIQYVSRPSTANKNAPVTAAPQNVTKKTTAGSLWFVVFIAMALLIFLFRETLGRKSFEIFVFLDNLLKFAQSLPPFISWILPGLLLGAIYGSIVAWKKYKLNFKINLLPIGAFAVILLLLVIVNKPLSENIMEQREYAPENVISDSPQQLILKRWKVVNITNKNRKHLNNKTQPELEFKDNGKCYVYENDVTTSFMYYTIADDDKSLTLTDPNKKDKTSRVQIISITKDELIIKSGMFGNETATLRAK